MFGNIFIYIFFLLITADIYIYILFIRRLTKSILLRSLWFLPSFLLLGGLFAFFFRGLGEGLSGLFMIIYIAMTLPKIVFSIISPLDVPFRIFFKWKIYPFTIVGLIISVFVLYIIYYGSTTGKSKFTVKEVTFYSSNLPESFNDFRIVHISDIHIGHWKDTVPIVKMVDMINMQNPDIVAITGDLVHYVASELDGYEEILSRINGKYGVFSVLGNHDYGTYAKWKSIMEQAENLINLQQRKENMGWISLNNSHVYLAKGQERIALIGVENDGEPPFHGEGDLSKALKGAENEQFKILLSHNPSLWRREALKSDIDLTLSGHTHGAQFSIFGLSFSYFRYKEWGGLYIEGNQGLYVNVGVGNVGLPFRYGAFPEITVITLKN